MTCTCEIQGYRGWYIAIKNPDCPAHQGVTFAGTLDDPIIKARIKAAEAEYLAGGES